MRIMRYFIRVCTVCHSTRLGVSGQQRVNYQKYPSCWLAFVELKIMSVVTETTCSLLLMAAKSICSKKTSARTHARTHTNTHTHTHSEIAMGIEN